MNTKREIFDHFTHLKIYLNWFHLCKIEDMLSCSKNKLSELSKIEKEYNKMEFKDENARLKAHYTIDKKVYENHIKRVSKPVNRISLETGQVLERYPSLIEAARAMGNKNLFSVISQVCKGKGKSCSGFGWSYEQIKNK